MLPLSFATPSSSQPMVIGVIILTPPGRGANPYIFFGARASKLVLLLFIPAFPLLVAKRDALAPLVSAAFQSFWCNSNALQSTAPLEGLYLVPQRFQPGAKRL